MRSERRNDRVVVTIILVILASALAACGNGPTGPEGAPEPITELPRALTASERALLDAGNRFGLNLLGELAPAHRSENLFFSPLSASMALGMTLNGAGGTTYDQMAATLGYPGMSQDDINASYATLLDLLVGLDPSVTVEIANSVWYRDGLAVDAGFLDRVRRAFDAEVAGVDFGAPTTLGRINGWVEDRTNGTIDKLLDRIPGNLVMFLANAVYFKADWTDAFDPARTAAGDFRTGGGTVQADFMRKRAEVRMGEHVDGVTTVELPYGGQAWAMTLLLPPEGTDPADLLDGVDPAAWARWVDEVGTREIELEMPKFELDWTRRLNDDLVALGMVDAFDGGRADFTRMIPGGGVWISEVVQKSYVKVDERGTEASAATGVSVVESAPPRVRFDRPFALAIRERLSGTILFLGVVRDPS